MPKDFSGRKVRQLLQRIEQFPVRLWDSLEKIKAWRDSKEFAEIRRSAKNRQRSATALQSKLCRNSSLQGIPTRQRGRQPGGLLASVRRLVPFPARLL